MNRTANLLLAAGLTFLAPSFAMAHRLNSDNSLNAATQYPGAPHIVRDDKPSPYPMNYADEAAQNLGVRNGHMELFNAPSHDAEGLAPTVSGGVDGNGAMFKLQWHPGE
jgi:hypothetical protein